MNTEWKMFDTDGVSAFTNMYDSVTTDGVLCSVLGSRH